MAPSSTVKQEIDALGYRVRYVPYETIGERVACYHVVYDGRTVKPDAAGDLGIPPNETRMSGGYRDREDRVPYHELREIQYRARGWKPGRAHRQADQDEEAAFGPRLSG